MKTLAEGIRCTQIFHKKCTPIILIIKIFTCANDFDRIFEFEIEIHKFAIENNCKKRRSKSIKMCMSEIVTVVVMFYMSGYKTFKDFYKNYIWNVYKVEFPKVVSFNLSFA
jgi:hypothetical protein